MIARRSVMLMAGLLATAPVWFGAASEVRAEDASGGGGAATRSPVVVELFTSQGCSSCPPADRLLAQLAGRADVLPLALHVDYWDYLGWQDALADPKFTRRQKAYAQANGKRMIYTPQMIVGGTGFVKGTHPMQLSEYITRMQARPETYKISVTAQVRQGSYRLGVQALNGASDGPMMVQLVQYLPSKSVEIHRGENAGEVVNYTNIVTHWAPVAEWDGKSDLDIEIDAAADRPGAVLVQRKGYGAIEAAARLPQ